MTKRITKLRVESIDGVDAGAAVAARVALMKRRDEDVVKSETEVEVSVSTETPTTEQETETMPTLEQVLAKLTPEERKCVEDAIAASATAAKAACGAQDPQAEMMKRLPEEIRKQLESERATAKAEREALEKARAEDRARIEKMEEASLTREYVEKARALPFGVPGLSTEELAEVQKNLDRGRPVPTEVAKKLSATFAAIGGADGLIAKSELFKERGSQRGGSSSGSAEGELQAIAKRLVEEGKAPNISLGLAMAAKANPELYKRHAAESRK